MTNSNEMKGKWTPGNWELHYSLSDGAFAVIEGGSDFIICQRARHSVRAEELQADAKLIAKAPKMAELLLKYRRCGFSDLADFDNEAEQILREIGAL